MTDLVKRSKKGDKEAFAQLIDQNRQMLYNTALLVLRQEDDALDALQDAILACWENLPSLRKDRYFKTWLVKILLNKCRDVQRGKSHFAYVEELPESGDEPDWDTSMDVRRTMDKLGENDQLLLSLFYYDDFSVRQIADALSLSEGAVRTRLTRSRERFKKLYVQEKGECL
ncbi:MAG TPA: sigma-70 family RNA polymerase sigma factor [Candidatus Acutalibacter pullicola]|uniref:Sigma-70 family RNA polymerase sigma factor n=1 Tax=Candidatus Acutalibacter pullicola TaxID=2838417 RepID=A0A9D2MWR0_9FIRM|nr:sigma-70 family RNA polymerase sigma factor [Candidatus Acutalibacter pullicola]